MSSSGLPLTRSKKIKPSPPPQPSDDDCTDSSSSEEEEIPPSPPPQSEQRNEKEESSDDDAEESSDDENAEEDQDQDKEDPVTKPKQDPQTPAAALTVVAPTLDGVRPLVLGTPSGAASLAPTSNRIWQDPMQLLLLREMVGYSKINGNCKLSLSYVSKFHSSLVGSPLHKFSVNQILEKMKLIKKRYDNLYGKGKRKRKGNPLNPELLELSRKLWGEAERGVGRKWKRVKVEIVENGGDDDVNDNDNDNDNVGDNSVMESTVWESAMVRLMNEKFYYPEDYTRQKIASMDESSRDFLEKRWLNRKGKLNTAIVNFGRAEIVCLKALLSS